MNNSKCEEAKDVFHTLVEKHTNRYKPEQLHAWAEMIQMKKHLSLETPPDLPFFKTKEKPEEPKAAISSPSRRIQTRSLCIEQLQRIGDLLEKCLLTQEQYNTLHETIIKDIIQ